MKKIHIFGAAGSGTTTLGEGISKKLKFVHLDTDNYFWEPTDPPYTTKREVNTRIELFEKDILSAEKAVITGSLCGWGDVLIPYFDLVIQVITPTEVRIERLGKREYKNFGKRILPGGDMYMDHVKFIEWAREYDTGDMNMRSRVLHDDWMSKITCKKLIVDGTLPVEEIIDYILVNHQE